MTSVILFVLIVAALVGVLYGWIVGRAQIRKLEMAAWRRACAETGLIVVTAQAVLFIAFWTPLFRDDAILTRWVRGSLLLPVLAIPCVLTARGRSCWWLLLSSIVLVIGSFFAAPTP